MGWYKWFKLVRVFVLGHTLVICFLMCLWSKCFNINLDFVDVLLISFSILFVHAFAQLLNMIWDVDVDRVNKPFRPLVTGEVRRRIAIFLDILFITIAFTFALVEQLINSSLGNYVIRLGILTFFATMFTIGLVRKNPWSHCIWMGITRGLLPPIVVYGFNNFIIWEIAFIMFTWVTFFNIVKDFPDVKGDKMFGIKTIVNTYGEKFAIKYMYVGTIIFYGLVLTFSIINYFILNINIHYLLLLITIPLALTIPRTVHMPPAFSDNNLAYDLFWWGLTLNYVLITTTLLTTTL